MAVRHGLGASPRPVHRPPELEPGDACLRAQPFDGFYELERVAPTTKWRAVVGEGQRHPTAAPSVAGDLEHGRARDHDITLERRDGKRVESVALGEEPRPGRMVERGRLHLGLHERFPARIVDLERVQRQSDRHSVADRSRARLVTADMAGSESNAAESPRRIQKMK